VIGLTLGCVVMRKPGREDAVIRVSAAHNGEAIARFQPTPGGRRH
jgi:hypothetical protein